MIHRLDFERPGNTFKTESQLLHRRVSHRAILTRASEKPNAKMLYGTKVRKSEVTIQNTLKSPLVKFYFDKGEQIANFEVERYWDAKGCHQIKL